METYDIKGKIAQLRTALGDEKGAEMSPVLSEIQSTFISLETDNIANIAESIGRKKKLREQAETVSDLEAKVEKLGDDTALKELQAENVTLKAFQTQVHGDTRKNLINRVESYKDNEKFAEVRDNLGLKTKAAKDLEGKDILVFDPESMDAAAVTHSLSKIMEYESLKVFGENGADIIDSTGTTPIRDTTVKKTDKVDIAALAKSDPAAAAAILKKEGMGDRSFNGLVVQK